MERGRWLLHRERAALHRALLPWGERGAVAAELQRIVDEWLAIHGADKRALPAPLKAREFSGKFVLGVPPPVHQALALRAQAAGQSLNAFCAERLASVSGASSR